MSDPKKPEGEPKKKLFKVRVATGDAVEEQES